MADAAVEFLLGNLQQLLIYHGNLIKDAKEQVEKLDYDLRLFRAFLRDTTKKRRKDDSLREIVRQIRDVVYQAEDIIDTFVTKTAEVKSRSYFARALKRPVDLHDIAKQVETVSRKVNAIYGDKSKIDFAILNIGDGTPEDPPEAPIVKQDNVVGFEDEADKITGYLKEKKYELDVISIIGMPGLGKTTLAGKIFHDKTIQYEFPTRIWVYVSQEFSKKNVFLAILKELMQITDDMYRKPDNELAEKVRAKLDKGKFLIVMDDVWTAEDWEKIQVALPKRNSDCKILITSRHIEVARFANRNREPHMLRFLNPDESWLLLQYEVFGKPECPNELEVFGKLIAEHCGGLPLAIVVIGGILAKKFSVSDDMVVKKNAMTKVSENVSMYLTEEDKERRMEKIIALSYDKLPYHLRACFLYLAIFPEDFEIPAWKLVRMWIAEGFIQPKENISLEETAENYLDELINRNLVRVDKRKPDGKVKTCRIHDMLRDFCKNEAGDEKENFLQEIKKTKEGRFENLDAVENHRRICIHSNVLDFISSTPLGPCVRSFVCFSNEDLPLPADKISKIPASFKLLRVLDVKPIKFSRIPSDMYQLLHLRYLNLSFDLKSLPSVFIKLWNLETLIVKTISRNLEIKADIWKLRKLRHFKTNASAILLHEAVKSATEGENLQTLGTISPQSCTDEVFDRCRKLKKLGIHGKLDLLLESHKTVSFDRFGKLDNLEKLKLLNDAFPSASSEVPLSRLPPPYQFPPKLKSLTLSNTCLNWTQMSILGLLESLEVLKLKDNAFVGKSWTATDGGFRHLEFLHIGRTDLTVWKASHHHYPRLRCLELHNCEKLSEVPIGLADIPAFRLLDLHRSKHAVISAKRIRDAKQEQKKPEEKNIKGSEFKLSIFPPIID